MVLRASSASLNCPRTNFRRIARSFARCPFLRGFLLTGMCDQIKKSPRRVPRAWFWIAFIAPPPSHAVRA